MGYTHKMTNEYTPEQAREIAGFLDDYRIMHEKADTINDLIITYDRGYLGMRGILNDLAKSLRTSVGEFKKQVPQSIRENLHGPRLEALETLATNTLLKLE
jgi:hypothetical protein